MRLFSRWVGRAFARKYHTAEPSASSQASYSCEFISWLSQWGEINKDPPVSIAVTQFGRALVASRKILSGSRILEVPRSVIITPDKIPPEVEDFLTTDNAKSRLALILLAEKHKGLKSAWAPYIQSLPRLGEIQSTIFWKPDELAWLEHSIAHRETTQRLEVVASEYNSFQTFLPKLTHIFGKVTLADFMHSYGAVTSRAWGGQEQVPSMSMIPFADFLNHDHACRTRLHFDKENDCAVAVADRDYAPGEEVFLNYGASSNAILAVDYGFALPSNPYEQVNIRMEISQDDPLRDEKIEMLSRHNMNTDLHEDGFQSGAKSFTLRKVNSRDDLRLASLFAFARVICANSQEDLEEMVEESIVRDEFYAISPRKEKLKEVEALEFVSSCIRQHIDRHSKSLETVQLETKDSARKSIALSVLRGELSVLQSVSTVC